MGPFSRTSTVPLYCEGLRDPEARTRSLLNLPQSALRLCVHVLSDRARSVKRFIFVGELGLRGGGNGKGSSNSDAHGRRTAAEGNVSDWVTRRALIRTDSSIIRRTLIGRQYCTLDEVVKAFNEADDAQERHGLAEVIRRVLYAFNDMPVRAATNNRGAVVREYLALCRLKGKGDEHLLLLKDFFDSLRDKLCNDVLHNRYLIEAVEHTLQSIDAEIFEYDKDCLLQPAQFLLNAFDPQKTSFTRDMFPVQCSALHVVHQCLRILFDIGSGSWDPNKPEELYAKFKDWSQRVIDAARHYPAKHQAMLVQQSLTFLQSSARSVYNANNARRIANLVYGTVGVCQAVRKAVFLDFDLGNAESTASALARARENRIVREEQWYKCLHALDTVRFAAIEDPSAFGQFNELLSSLVLEERGSNQEECKALRFGVVEMLTSLAIHGRNDAVRFTSAETLSRLADPRDEWDWSSDPDLFLEMLDNLAELSARGIEPEKHIAHEAIEKLVLNVHDRACEGVLSEWLEGKTVDERIQSVQSVRTETIDNKLFTQVLKSIEAELSRAPTELRHSPPKKHHCLFSPLVVRHFAGRECEYTELVEAFESSTEQVVVKAVVGPGGIGKSQLAAKVFKRLKSTGNYVNDFWIPSNSAEGLSAAFLQIAEFLELSTDNEIPRLVRRVHEELSKSRGLFVFDDAPDLESIREYLSLVNGHVIVTTRDSGARDWSRDMVRLDPFDKLEARDLAGKFGFIDQTHAKDLDELFDALPQYPLALTQFFSMMENEELSSPAEWLIEVQHYDASRREAEVMEKLSAKEDSGMVFVFNSSVQRISEKPGDLGSRSLDLLAKLAVLDPNGVPIEWVYKWLGSEDRHSRKTTKESVRLLERFSHVMWDRDKNKIFIHAETQLLARHILLNIGESVSDTKKASKEQTKERNITDHIRVIVHSVGQYIDDWRTDRSNRDLWTSLAQNLSTLIKHCENSTDLEVKFKLIKHMSRAYTEMCMFHESLSYSQRALEMCKSLHGEADNSNLVECIRSYADGLSQTGRDNEALPLRKKALEMCERLHGDADHPDLVNCIRKYSVGLSRTGRDNEAKPFYMRALEMCERLHGGADHTDLVICMQNYSVGLSRTGRDIEALPIHKSALEMCERLHGDADHPDLVNCIRKFSIGLSRTGRDNKALPMYKKALEMCERLHGDADHPDLVQCIQNYAVGLSRVGNDNEALPLRKRALEMCERLHGDADHPDLIQCIQNYAAGLLRAGRNHEALPLYERALEMCERLHGDSDHPDLIQCIRNYAVGLSRTGRDDEALPLYERALEMCERLHGGSDHPDLVQCVRNYAVGLSRTRSDNEALPVYERALEMCKRLHGNVDHPDLVESIRSYADGLSRAGRNSEALPLYRRALEMCERLHGDTDHPDLFQCIQNYAAGLSRSDKDDEALPLRKRALEMSERLHGHADHTDLFQCIQNYAVELSHAERDHEALSLYKKALEMCERLHGDADHPDVVQCIQNYAVGLSRVGNDNEALPLRKRALEMCECLHGDADHLDLVQCIRNYAEGLSRAGNDNEALPLRMRALEMCERLHGDSDHPDLIQCIQNYAAGLSRADRFDKALPLYRRALDISERLHGDADHPDLVQCIQNYADGLSRAGNDNEALPLRMRALEMCERLHGDSDHPDLVQCIQNYADGLSRAGSDNEALPLRMRALEMCERLHGDSDHPDLAKCIQNYAVGLSGARRDYEAVPLYERALEMCNRFYGDTNHPDLVKCIRNCSVGLSKTGRDNEALPLRKRALDMCEHLHGDADHPDLVQCMREYATGLSHVGRNKEALPLYKRAVEMSERLHRDVDHPDLVECMKNYSFGLSRSGKVFKAWSYSRKAKRMRNRLAGKHHSCIFICRSAIVLCKCCMHV